MKNTLRSPLRLLAVVTALQSLAWDSAAGEHQSVTHADLCIPNWDADYYPVRKTKNDETIPILIRKGAFFRRGVIDCVKYDAYCNAGQICNGHGQCVNGECQCDQGYMLVEGSCER